MKRILTIVFLLSLNFGFGHDLRMAIFEISEGENGLELSVSIDRDGFMTTLQENCNESLIHHEFEDAVWEYLDSHMKIYVNDKLGKLDVGSIELGDQNIFINGALNVPDEIIGEIREIRMTNSCLVETIEGHDNLMKLKINDRQRSFRLNKDRISTTATY